MKTTDKNGLPGGSGGGGILKRRWYLALLLCAVLTHAAPAALHFFGAHSAAAGLVDEDGPYETAGALACLLGSGVVLTAYARFPGAGAPERGTRRNHFLLLFGLFLFFLFGEEISWGQRLLNWDAGMDMAKVSFQEEFNLHNLKIGQASNNQFATYGAKLLLLYLTLPAVAAALFPKLREAAAAIRIPIPSLWIACITAVNYILLKVIKGLFETSEAAVYAYRTSEIFELNLELLLLVFTAELYLAGKRNARRTG